MSVTWGDAAIGMARNGDRGTAASGGDAGGREGRGGGDQPVEKLTLEAMTRTEGHGEDGRRRYRAHAAAGGGEVTDLHFAKRSPRTILSLRK